MRVLTTEECAAWCRKNRFSLGESDEPQLPEGADLISFAVPRESGIQLALAREMGDWIESRGPALLWMTDWPGQQEDETFLVQTWRKAHGEDRPPIEAPGYLLEEKERNELVNLLYFVMAFGWDAFILLPRQKDLVYLSHDEYGDIYTPDLKSLASLQEMLRLLSIRMLKL